MYKVVWTNPGSFTVTRLLQQHHDRSDMHEAEEVSRGLFVARRDAALVLDSVHETLDQVPFFVQVLVVVSRLLAVALGRNDRLCSVRFNGLDEGVAVIALVGQDGLGLVALQKRLRLGDIRLLPGSSVGVPQADRGR